MKTKQSLGGKQISRKEALKGLGDSETWEKQKEETMKEFKKKPNATIVVAAICPECHDRIYSRATHDFRSYFLW